MLMGWPDDDSPLILKGGVSGEIDGHLIKLRTRIMDTIYAKVIDTENTFIREALISMGWTPPEVHK